MYISLFINLFAVPFVLYLQPVTSIYHIQVVRIGSDSQDAVHFRAFRASPGEKKNDGYNGFGKRRRTINEPTICLGYNILQIGPGMGGAVKLLPFLQYLQYTSP